jgi:hypothetical protein
MPTRDEKLYTVRQPEQTAAQPAMTTQQPTQMQPVSYIDNGQRKTGVATVPKQEPSYYDQQRAGYQEMYDEAVRANREATERASQQAREAAEAERAARAAGYQGTNRQLYRDYMQRQRVLPQQMAAGGYSGGLSESARVRLRNSYEEAMAENERSRMREQAAADANLSNRLYEIQTAADRGDQEAWQRRQDYEQALRDQQRQEQIGRADTLAAAGDFSGYAGLGYTQAQIDAMTRSWLASNPDMTASWIAGHPEEARRLGISNPNTGGYTPEDTLTRQMEEAAAEGQSPDTIREIARRLVETGAATWQQMNTALWRAGLARDLPGHTPGREPVRDR